ncbi:metallophosphoesterase family protein [Marinobacter sp. 1_MG-2023]|uniref:metallophosphoesterase family protein n=1 Tax=Marinobacter sp. 1_MG-2023 TaxID=3062627 RepID=UPI0026E25194|nr:metallophosphoesterase family protein [Marinobacter sp. 1_MG-2023]MDO6822862.1 metallophosphoesterase family protein [Marinobacter sp. 1_MG-2023]
MRLRILSDLHIETFREGRELPDVAADVVILAGDIHRTTEGLAWAAERFVGQEIIYVAGNHEFYGTSMPEARQSMRAEARRLGIHLLDNDTVNIGGVRFHGTTLWTDFSLYDGQPDQDPLQTERRALAYMPDFRIIEQPTGEVFTTAESQKLHAEAIAWLEAQLSEACSGPQVVISHHAPLPECIPPKYQGDILSPAFASDLRSLMGKMDLWVHGHVHEPVDLQVEGTRVFANPGAYPKEYVPPLFVADRIIEV